MPTLRSMIDNTTFHAAGIAPPMAAPAPPPGNAMPLGKSKPPQPGKAAKPAAGKAGKGSPMASHISDHVQDPLGATKEGFGNLTQKKLEYDQAREEMQRNLTPVQGVIDHLSNIHGIMPGTPAGQVPTPGMTPGQQPGQIDPNTGLPMDPAMAGQDPNNPGQNDDPDMDPATGNPANMSQTTGKMNQSRPSMAGHQPGVSPGPSENVRPGKMGMPKPGGGMPQNNKQAAKPKGAGGMPGAKGPGDPKVGNKTKQAQGNSSRQVKISVAASSSSGLPVIHASRTIESQFGIATLSSLSINAGGPGSGRHKGADTLLRQNGFKYKGTDKGQDARGTTVQRSVYTHPEHSKIAVEPNGSWNHGMSGAGSFSRLAGHLKGLQSLNAAGTSSGSKKQWSTRNKGHLSGKEKQEHYKTMDAMQPVSGLRPGSAGSGKVAPGRIGTKSGPSRPVGGRMFSKRVKAGPAQLSDKVTTPGTELSYNPKLNAGTITKCMKCGKLHAGKCMQAGGPGSGRKAGFAGPKQQTAHQMLTRSGFKYTGTDKGSGARGQTEQRNVYRHPEHGKIAVSPNGGWNHGMTGAGNFAALTNHLDYLKN